MIKSRTGKWFLLIPAGLFLIACALYVTQYSHCPDAVKGILFGISIGLLSIPFIARSAAKSEPEA